LHPDFGAEPNSGLILTEGFRVILAEELANVVNHIITDLARVIAIAKRPAQPDLLVFRSGLSDETKTPQIIAS
jgi:hypothetical protein